MASKRRNLSPVALISWLLLIAMIISLLPVLAVPAGAENGDGGQITEDEANALLAAAGTSVVDIALSNHIDDVNTNEYGLCGGNSHLQGICVDSELKYMFFSYTSALAVIDIATGKLVASVGGFGGGSFGTNGGAHLGCIEYWDGHVYGSLEYKSPGKKFYLAIFDVERMLKAGVGVSIQDENYNWDEPIVTAVLLAEPTADFRDPLDTEVFVDPPQDEFGHATNEQNNGHRFACSGIDGVTVGKWPGGKDNELYIIVAYGVYAFSKINRYDNTYNVLQYYKLSDIWNSDGSQSKTNRTFTYHDGISQDWAHDAEIWQSAAKTLYVYTGNTSYGAQNIEYEWDTGDVVLYTYDNTDGFGKTMYIVDGSVEPEYKTLELGQNNTLKPKMDRYYAKWIAEAYATDINGNGIIDANEYMKGYVGTLKCICGNPSSHTDVGSEQWGTTGVRKADQMICSASHPASSTTGIAWIGADPDDSSADYFFIANGAYSTGLYRRTINSSGVSFRQVKWLEQEKVTAEPIVRWSMDAADLKDGRIINSVDPGTYGGYYKNVVSGEGVDGAKGGSMYFDGDADSLDYSRAWMSEDGLKALNDAIGDKITISYWYKPERSGADNYTSEWAPILGLYTTQNWPNRGAGRFQLVTEFRYSGLVMGMINTKNQGDLRSRAGSGANGTDWHHIVMTVDLSQVEKVGNADSLVRHMYIDGINVGQERALPTNNTDALNNMEFFEIGGAPFKCWSDTNVRGRFSGWIDDVRIYDSFMNAKQVAYLLQSDKPVTTGAGEEIRAAEKPVAKAAYVFDKASPADLTITFGEEIKSVDGIMNGCYRISGKDLIISADYLMSRQPGAFAFKINGSEFNVNILNSAEKYPIAYYKLDAAENGKTADASGNGMDAQVYNGVTFADGAASFNGYDETKVNRIQLDGTDYLGKAIDSEATISFWFSTGRIVGNITDIAGLYTGAAPSLAAQMRASGGERQGALPGVGEVKTAAQSLSADNKTWDANVVTGSAVAANTWTQMTVVYKDSKAYVYINGALVSSGGMPEGALSNVDSFILGGAKNVFYPSVGNAKSQRYQTNFYGSIDDVIVYNAALSADDVKAINTAGRGGITLPVDVSGLEYLIEKAEKSGNAALADAISAAKKAADDSGATAESITAASEELIKAMQSLVSKDELKKALDDAAGIDTEGYTDESVKALNDAIANANEVMASFAATQADVDAAKKALDDAVKALEVKKPAVKFIDVADNDWFGSAVYWAVGKGITKGVSETEFAPFADCKRCEIVTFLYRAAGEPNVDGVENPFTDVAKTDYFYNAVLWAVSEGITNGTSATTFSPNDACTRAQFVTFLWRWQDKPEATAEVTFKDIDKAAFYYDAVRWAFENGITNGRGSDVFAPNDTCNRAETVVFLYRAMNK